MPRPRYHHGDLRAELLRVGDILVRERGVRELTLRELAGRTGVSASALYHHFASKEQLVLALATVALADLGASIAAELRASPDDDPVERLAAIGRAYVRWALAEPARFDLAFGAERTYTGTPVDRTAYELIDAEIGRLVAAGRLDAEARERTYLLLWSAIHGLATLAVNGALAPRPAAAMDALAGDAMRAVVRGLGG